MPVCILAAGLFAAGCGGEDTPADKARAKVPADAVALVGDAKIGKDRFERELKARAAGSSPLIPPKTSRPEPLDPPAYARCIVALRRTIPSEGAKVQPPSRDALLANCKARYEQMRVATVGALVQERWAVEEAKRLRVEVSADEARRALDQVIASFSPDAPPAEARRRFDDRLARSGLTREDVLEQQRVAMIDQRLAERAAKAVPAPSTAEARRFYERDPDQFAIPAARRAEVVVTGDEATAARAKRELASGTGIGRVSRLTVDPAISGQRGVVTVGRGPGILPEKVTKALFAARRGSVRGVVGADARFYVFRVVAVVPARRPPFRDVVAQAKERLRAQSAQELRLAGARALAKRYRPLTRCADGLKAPQCVNGPTTGV